MPTKAKRGDVEQAGVVNTNFGYMVWHVCDEYAVEPPLPKGLVLDKLTGNLHGSAQAHFA